MNVFTAVKYCSILHRPVFILLIDNLQNLLGHNIHPIKWAAFLENLLIANRKQWLTHVFFSFVVNHGARFVSMCCYGPFNNVPIIQSCLLQPFKIISHLQPTKLANGLIKLLLWVQAWLKAQ